MTQRMSTKRTWGGALLAGLLSFLIATPYAYPEAYIGGQIGTTLAGNSLSRVDLTDFSPLGSMSGRDLAGSPLLGGKVGYYFPKVRWFGIEFEANYRTPHIEQQQTRVSIPTSAVLRDFGPVTGGEANGILSGDHFRVITIAPINLMFRYHKIRLQPYFGIGPGIFLAKVTTTQPAFAGSQSSTQLGLNAKVGAEYFFTKHFTGFVEAKYNYARFNFESNSTGSFGFRGTYNPLFLSFGVSYHF